MLDWKEYPQMEPANRLKRSGEEYVGHTIYITLKRDGANISLWMDDQGHPIIASHLHADTQSDVNNVKTARVIQALPAYTRAVHLLNDNPSYILYGELLRKGKSPTKIEQARKRTSWILFDILDRDTGKFLSYRIIEDICKKYKVPLVRLLGVTSIKSLDDLANQINFAKSWCQKHHIEGVVLKCYNDANGGQTFSKEKITIKRYKTRKSSTGRPALPPMPHETILRALQHSWDEVITIAILKGISDVASVWKDVRITMPIVAKHMAIEASEHGYAQPRNIYQIYLETPIEEVIVTH